MHLAGCKSTGWGALELNVDVATGELRIVEVFDDGALNGQMVADVPVAQGGKALAAISPPVLRRLLDGRTQGLAVFSMDKDAISHRQRPVLYLNFEQPCEAAGS